MKYFSASKDNKNCFTTSISKKQSDDYGKIAAAYHESSHCLVGLANVIYIENCIINQDNGGSTDYVVYDIADCKDEGLKKIILASEASMIFAGLLGERIYYQDITGSHKFPNHLKMGSSIDNGMASDLIRKNNLAAPGKETADLKKKLKQGAENLLKEHWSSVKSIAHALYKRSFLSFDELKYILTRHPEDGRFWKEKMKQIMLVHNENNQLSEETIKTLISPKI